MEKFCCIDTEFNAFDYRGQNEATQEVVEIGCAVIENGVIVDVFSRKCRLLDGHVLTKRCKSITGIREDDLKHALMFPQVLDALRNFLKKNGVQTIYALGNEDRNQMIRTAEFYSIPRKNMGLIRNIQSAERELNTAVGNMAKNLVFSLSDLCYICGIANEKEHTALADAKALALCMSSIRRKTFSRERAKQLGSRKQYHSLYMQCRRVKDKDMDEIAPVRLQETLLQELETALSAAELESYRRFALLDDLRVLSGREAKYEFWTAEAEELL